MDYKEEYAAMRPKVLKVLRSSKKPLTALEIAKKTGFRPGKIAYGLCRKWADDVVVITDIPRKYTAKNT